MHDFEELDLLYAVELLSILDPPCRLWLGRQTFKDIPQKTVTRLSDCDVMLGDLFMLVKVSLQNVAGKSDRRATSEKWGATVV